MKTCTYDTNGKTAFEESVQALVKSIEKNNFKVLHIHDIQATFAGKGIKHGSYKIIEFCRAPVAKKVLDIDPQIGLFLPCKAIVFEKDGEIKISVMSPKVITHFFNDSCVNDTAENIDQDIQKIINYFNNEV